MTPRAMGNECRVFGKAWGVTDNGQKTALGSATENLVETRVLRVQMRGEQS